MKKILFLFAFLTVFSCKSSKFTSDYDNVLGSRMVNLYERVFTASQFDSICVADKLPTDLKKWHQSAFRDEETHEVIKEYLYIKQLNKYIEEIYRSEELKDNNFKVTKRVISVN